MPFVKATSKDHISKYVSLKRGFDQNISKQWATESNETWRWFWSPLRQGAVSEPPIGRHLWPRVGMATRMRGAVIVRTCQNCLKWDKVSDFRANEWNSRCQPPGSYPNVAQLSACSQLYRQTHCGFMLWPFLPYAPIRSSLLMPVRLSGCVSTQFHWYLVDTDKWLFTHWLVSPLFIHVVWYAHRLYFNVYLCLSTI